MIMTVNNGQHTFMTEIVEGIAERYPSQKQIANLFADMNDEEKESFAASLQAIQSEYGMNRQQIINCYELFISDTLEESKFFYENDCYRCSTYEEVAAYMQSKDEHYMHSYQVGLLLSLFLWPNHSEMRKHFVDTFNGRKGKGYLEIGVGHGYYFGTAVTNSDYESYLGIDISEDSLNMAKAILSQNKYCSNENYRLELKDFFKMSCNQKFDAIVSGEVLEHVENPSDFLKKMSELSHDNTLIYISTAINAPAIDHISLFRGPDELEHMFQICGLDITEMKLFLYRGKSLEACLKRKLPITVAITAKKA